DLPRVRMDKRRMRQVLLNLLSNALKFTPAGGNIRVCGSLVANGVALSVTDTGIGMRMEDVPIALSNFGQIDNSLARKYEGSGLGLPLVKQLVELHGGTIEISSALGSGTTVTATLPHSRVVQATVPVSAVA